MNKRLVPALVLAVAAAPAAAAPSGFNCQCPTETGGMGLCHAKADFSLVADPSAGTLVMTRDNGHEFRLEFTITQFTDAALSAGLLRGDRQDGVEMTMQLDEGSGRYRLDAVLYTEGEKGLSESFSGICTRAVPPQP